MTENVAELFQYELCSQPSSLFDQHGLLREVNKAQLADDIWTVAKGNEMQPPEIAGEMNHVIDGGLLLKQILWKRDETFNSIAKGYVGSGLEIATDTGAFATKIFAFATKICRQVANLRPVCCRSFGHMLATGDYFKPKLIKEYHIEESCVLFINKKSKSSGKILLNLP